MFLSGGLEIRAIFIERLTQHGAAWSGSTLRYKSHIFLSSGCETAGFRICQSDILVGDPFSGVDSTQLGYAFDELKEPDSR